MCTSGVWAVKLRARAPAKYSIWNRLMCSVLGHCAVISHHMPSLMSWYAATSWQRNFAKVFTILGEDSFTLDNQLKTPSNNKTWWNWDTHPLSLWLFANPLVVIFRDKHPNFRLTNKHSFIYNSVFILPSSSIVKISRNVVLCFSSHIVRMLIKISFRTLQSITLALWLYKERVPNQINKDCN